jgi:hypothetical protein
MTQKTKGYFFIVFLILFVVLHMLLPKFPVLYALFQNFDIFQQDQYNFISLMIFFVLLAYALILYEFIGKLYTNINLFLPKVFIPGYVILKRKGSNRARQLL